VSQGHDQFQKSRVVMNLNIHKHLIWKWRV